MTELGNFEGRSVRGTTLALRNAGDGLSAAMEVDPVILHHGERVILAIECEVADVQFPPVDKKKSDGDVTRKHVLRAKTATIVANGDVDRMLQEQHARIVAAGDAKKGQRHLHGVDEVVDELAERLEGPSA